jgi:hypothetical protein
MTLACLSALCALAAAAGKTVCVCAGAYLSYLFGFDPRQSFEIVYYDSIAELLIICTQDASAKRAELDAKTAESTLMKFTTADHNKYLTGGGRDYGVFVLFTATDPAFNCQNCKYVLLDGWSLLAFSINRLLILR